MKPETIDKVERLGRYVATFLFGVLIGIVAVQYGLPRSSWWCGPLSHGTVNCP